MNIYVRYFDQDALVYSIEELIDFLSTIPEISITQQLIDDIQSYIDGDMPYPKRYKIRQRVYFILIKTTAQTMEEFKANKKAAVFEPSRETANTKEHRAILLASEMFGWYFCSLTFKRVLQNPETGKCQYQDTYFSAFVKGYNGQDCYNRIVDHLKNRQDVDLRSQFPSARGNNFKFEYRGEEITPQDIQDVTTSF